MAEFLTTQGTSYYIEDIIRNAKNELVLISPYLQLSKTFFERLQDADRQNVKIILIYGKDELKPNEKKQLQELRNLSLYFFKHLHAKCFFNEESMVITSMNMYEFSEKTNREMGVLIRAKDDEKVYGEAVKEAQSIVHLATKDELKRPKSRSYSYKPRTKQTGHCLRCGKSIPLALGKPYCPDCFVAWSEWENPNYKEQYCHNCGKPAPTTMLKPQCPSCFRKLYS